mmetsp:Transcript_176/g.536  ORF Transcript_176/g.536 Transcript_176/m.536 type:complete len:333 (-) Transcript_176:197-1195(-)
MLTRPAECEERTLFDTVCGVLPVPVRVSKVVLVAPIPITVPITAPALMLSPTLNVGFVSIISPAMKSATRSLRPRETATPPNPNRPHTDESVTPTVSSQSNRNGIAIAVRAVLAPVVMRGSSARAFAPTVSTASIARNFWFLIAVSRKNHAHATYTGHGSFHWCTTQPTLAYRSWNTTPLPPVTTSRRVNTVASSAICAGTTAAAIQLVSKLASSLAFDRSFPPSSASVTEKLLIGNSALTDAVPDTRCSTCHACRARAGRKHIETVSTSAAVANSVTFASSTPGSASNNEAQGDTATAVTTAATGGVGAAAAHTTRWCRRLASAPGTPPEQ